MAAYTEIQDSDLINAQQDALTLALIVNGDSTQATIPLRQGGTAKSLRNAAATIAQGVQGPPGPTLSFVGQWSSTYPGGYGLAQSVQWTDGNIYTSLIAANTTVPSNTTNWKQNSLSTSNLSFTSPGTSAVTVTVQQLLSSTAVNVVMFGATGNGTTDDTNSIKNALVYATSLNKPIYLPTGNYLISSTLICVNGLIGDGPMNTAINVASSAGANFPKDKGVIQIGYASGAGTTQSSHCIVKDFSVNGISIRTTNRSGDETTSTTSGFYGSAIRLEYNAADTYLENIKVNLCYRGFDFANHTGHLGLKSCSANNCWYNWFISLQNGDYHTLHTDLSGPMYSSVGVYGGTTSANGNTVPGGLAASTMIDTHMGYGPYCIYFPDGNSALGLVTLTTVDARFEGVGNRAIYVGHNTNSTYKNSTNWNFTNQGHSWSGSGNPSAYPQYVILGDSNNPVQDYAIYVADLGSLFIFNPVTGSGSGSWLPGTTGYVGYVGTIQGRITDYPKYWAQSAGGANQYVYPPDFAGPYNNQYNNVQVCAGTRNVALLSDSGGGYCTIATFTIPPLLDGLTLATVDLFMQVNNTGSSAVTLQIQKVINPQAASPVASQINYITVPPGLSDIDFHRTFAAGRLDTTTGLFKIAIRIVGGTTAITVNTAPITGIASILMLPGVTTLQ